MGNQDSQDSHRAEAETKPDCASEQPCGSSSGAGSPEAGVESSATAGGQHFETTETTAEKNPSTAPSCEEERPNDEENVKIKPSVTQADEELSTGR